MNSILDESGVLDTNIWIGMVRAADESAPVVRIASWIPDLRIWLPLQVLKEVHANLADEELRQFYEVIRQGEVRIDWMLPPTDQNCCKDWRTCSHAALARPL